LKNFSQELRKRDKISESLLINKKVNNEQDLLGISLKTNKKVYLNSLNTKKHTFICGASGFGKTSLINILQEKKLRDGNTVIFVDPKGDLESINTFRALCKKNGRKLYIFSESYVGEESVSINPLKNGDVTQITDRVIQSFDWSEQFYRNISYNSIHKCVDHLKRKGETITFKNIFTRLNEISSGKEALFDEKNVSGILTYFDTINHSVFGPLLNGEYKEVSFEQIINEKACVYIGLSKLGYPYISKVLTKIFINDIMNYTYKVQSKLSTELRNLNQTSLFVDELGSCITEEFIELLNKCRSARFEITTAFQSPSDISKVDKDLLVQIIENSSLGFVFKQGVDSSAEFFAGMMGTIEGQKDTKRVKDGDLQEVGSRRDVREYHVNPDLIKKLSVGQCICLITWAKDT
jgi:conjugal transfer pilus assembly protein TraD